MTTQTIDIGYHPHAYQLDMHKRARRFSVVVAHRRFGKTYASVATLVHAALATRKENSRWGYMAPFLKQAKGAAWDYIKAFSRNVPNVKINEGELYVEFPNAARLRVFGGDNPESLRGLYFDGIVIDEMADLKPDVWATIIRPALADRKGWAIFIATPRGMNQLYDLYQDAAYGIRQPDGSRRLDPDWVAMRYQVDETHLISPDELASARGSMSDAQFRQEFLCDFAAASDNVLITIDVVSEACARQYSEADLVGMARVIGVDVARFGDDRTVIQLRQGLWAHEPEVIRGQDNMHVAYRVAGIMNKFHPHAVFIDEGGGQGVIDRLRDLGHTVIGVQFGGRAGDATYVNKRCEMWDLMAEWLTNGGRLPSHLELKTDLCVPTYSFDNTGRKKLESKDDIKKRLGKSPDCGDALALTFAFPVSARKSVEASSVMRGPSIAQMDYKPFAKAWGVAQPDPQRRQTWRGIGARDGSR